MRPTLIPPVAPCVVSHNLALGGAQTAVLRMIQCLPEWVRQRTTLYVQSDQMPLLDAAVAKHGFQVGRVTTEAPEDPSCWVLSYGNLEGLPARPTSLILHSWDDEGWRYVNRAYGTMRGMTVAGVSKQVLNRFSQWIEQGGHGVAGILPPPVTEWTICKGAPSRHRILVAWMGRPVESKGLMSLPYLLALDKRLVVRAWTGAETGGLEYTRRIQTQSMEKMLALADELGVADRLDLRPLDFDPFAYRHRLEGAHVLLGNSRREGFLMTAAEALSCGIPVVVTRTCGVSEFVRDGINGRLIDWDEDPQALAQRSYDALHRALPLDPMACLQSVRDLSWQACYRQTYGQTLAELTHTSLQHPQPRVTVGVRIHKGMPIESLDDAISSLALQTYRQFKTLLLVDGPWEYGEQLAARYNLPLLCTGMEPDITHCSSLHRQAVAECETEFYKPLDYDDQLLPQYLERAVRVMDQRKLDVYGCRLMTLQDGQFAPRWWPNKPLESMFTGNSDDNQLPHSSVLLRTSVVRRAGNYQERAIGLGADDYNLWHRIHQAGGTFFRDDEVRNVAYRIHEKNSLKIRRRRYGPAPQKPAASGARGTLIAGATAASMALWIAPKLPSASGADAPQTGQLAAAPIDPNAPTIEASSDAPTLAPPTPQSEARPAPRPSLIRRMTMTLDSASQTMKAGIKRALFGGPPRDPNRHDASHSPPHPSQHDLLGPPHS